MATEEKDKQEMPEKDKKAARSPERKARGKHFESRGVEKRG